MTTPPNTVAIVVFPCDVGEGAIKEQESLVRNGRKFYLEAVQGLVGAQEREVHGEMFVAFVVDGGGAFSLVATCK